MKPATASTVCCSPTASPLSSADADQLAADFKALADPVRLRILSALMALPQGEICACDFVNVAGKSQPTVSHHLKVLREAGLITGERRGTWIWYTAVPERLDQIRRALDPAAARV
ncbi:MAG: metalloregulator ArsR/SmtB family transcription factor [Nocardioidaceae bacterium]